MIFNKNLTVTESSELNVGERWYIKYLSATALVEVEIKEVSQKTVLLKEVNKLYSGSTMRYEKSNIKFVEKVKKMKGSDTKSESPTGANGACGPDYNKPYSVTQPATAYIPTVFVVSPELNVGELWYVKLPGWNNLTEARIVDMTEKTVEVKTLTSECFTPKRYKKTDIEFVEKAQ